MSNNVLLSRQEVKKDHVLTKQTISTTITDLKYLFKAGVLLSNVIPVITGLWLALYFTGNSFTGNWGVVLLTIIGSTMVMAGALVINNWYDVDIDSVMDRTKGRPTVTGHIPLKIVLSLGISLSILGLILLLFTTFEATIYAFIGWFTYVVLYTMWSKRRYTANTLIGSVSGGVTPLIGWAAIDSSFHSVPLVMFLILFIWQMPHTYAIAMKKHDEYKAAGVAMLPVVRGFKVTKWHMFVYIALLLPTPFLLFSLGTAFVVSATVMNFGWLLLSLRGFFTCENYKWAHLNFMYSVNYLMILFFLMIIVTMF